MRKLFIHAVAVFVLLAVASPAAAGLWLTGEATRADKTWAAEAAAYVPLAPGAVYVTRGWDPMWLPQDQILSIPRAGHGGWTARDEHYLLLHELGHVFDSRLMSPAKRDTFRQAIQSPCSWWSAHCKPPRNQDESVPPGERFAELYAACALGLTRWQVDDAGYPSYGWDPPVDDRSLCALFQRFA